MLEFFDIWLVRVVLVISGIIVIAKPQWWPKLRLLLGGKQKITIFWDEENFWTYSDLGVACQQAITRLKEEGILQTTIDAYGTEWVLHDPESGKDIPREIALFRGIRPESKLPKKLWLKEVPKHTQWEAAETEHIPHGDTWAG